MGGTTISSASGCVHQGLSAEGSMSFTLDRYRDRAIVMKRLSLCRISTASVWAAVGADWTLALLCGAPAFALVADGSWTSCSSFCAGATSVCVAASGSRESSEQADAAARSMTAARNESTAALRFAFMAIASSWMGPRSAAEIGLMLFVRD